MYSHPEPILRTFLLSGVALLLLSSPPQSHAAASLPQIAYDLPEAGKVALVINDTQGRRVRNLLAEADRQAGPNREPWDGCDDKGNPAPPGEYTVQGTVTPPLKLAYEFTLNNAGTVPWWRNVDNGNPMREKGGWMSDHSAPWDVATCGNLVFLSADATEHGNSLNVIDLDGKQVWATRWFGLAGARFVAADTGWVYVGAEGSWIGNKFQLIALSPRSFEFKTLAEFGFDKPEAGRGGGLSGLAAHEGKVAAAFNGPLADVMGSAVAADALDFQVTKLNTLQPAQAAAILRCAAPGQPWVNWPLPADCMLHVAWRKPCEIGAVLSPHRLEISSLKLDAAYPGDPAKDSDWEPLEPGPSNTAMNVYTAPAGRLTAALRVRVLDAVTPRAWTEPETARRPGAAAPKWFTGLRILRPALRGLAPNASCTAGSGTVFEGGAWENVQAADITPEQPAIYTLTPAEPTLCRAFVVRDPFFVAADVEIAATPGGPWIRCGELKVELPWRRAYTEATFDFHRDTTVAALRLKVTQPAVSQNADAKRRTGGRGNVCSLGGVTLLGLDSFDLALPPDLGQRITIFSGDDGKILQQISISSPGALEFTPDGRLLAVSGTQVVQVPLDGGTPVPLTGGTGSDRIQPKGLTVAPDGSLFVADGADNTVKQFSADGKYVRTIGKPGGLDVGPYDPAHMSAPMGLALDSRGRLWVAEQEWRPKKVSVWSLTDPTPSLTAFYIGGPPYGGDYMFPDPRNPSRFFFEGMEFEADWTTGKSHIKNIVWRGGKGLSWGNAVPSRPVYYHNRLYLVSEPQYFYDGFQVAGYRVVAQYDEKRGQAIPVAAAGMADNWPPLRDPALVKALGTGPLGRQAFIWSDLNCNERIEPEEIQLKADNPDVWRFWTWHIHMGYDLALQFHGTCLDPVKLLTKGEKAVPVYSFDKTRPSPKAAGAPTVAYGDNYHSMGVTRDDRIIELSSIISVKPRTGEPLWTYPAPWPGTQLSGKAPPPKAGQVSGQLGVMGTAVLPGIGEIFAVVCDKGDICVFTTDGLFVARLFRDNRYGRSWNFPEARRGMEVGDVSINGEHFGGTFTQMKDGRILLVVGHNHNSVVRVDGLDRIRRFSAKVTLGAEPQAGQPAANVTSPPPPSTTLTVPRDPGVTVDGVLKEWPETAFVTLNGVEGHVGRIAAAWNDERLCLAFEVHGRPAMQNEGDDPGMLFKNGDSVDLQLGPDPKAEAGRADAAPGDLRLSISLFEGKPLGVLYRYRVPGSPESERRTFASPVASVVVDAIERIDADIRIVADGFDVYVVEAAIPWKSLHTAPPAAGTAWRGDLGILYASEGGGKVAERLYWANRETGLVSDVPGELRVHPNLWGTLRFK